MPLSGCVKTPLGIVAEWFASELKDVDYEILTVTERGYNITVTVFPEPGRYVTGNMPSAAVIAGAEDPQTLRALTQLLNDMKEQL